MRHIMDDNLTGFATDEKQGKCQNRQQLMDEFERKQR
jgi:hypothetical protein